MAKNSWIIVGISGVTCGGKTTLATKINEKYPQSKIINQDVYFYLDDSPHHVKVPNMDHNNYDILSSLDMEKMYSDIIKIISEPNGETNEKNILIVEGFTVLNYKPIMELCDLKYQLILNKGECWRRRCLRVYDPPDIPGYFENCVWPEYIKYMNELKDYPDIIYLDGTDNDLLKKLTQTVQSLL